MRVVRESSGQATIEWTGAVVVVVALALALAALTPQVAHGVTAAVRAAICKLEGGACPVGSVGPPTPPGAPWDSPDPVRRATWGTYVSLGDSYSAGEGLGDYQPGTHVEKSRCRVSILGHCVFHKDPKVLDGCDRSSGAYNSTVSGTYEFRGGKQTWACSGSITRDVYDGPGDPSCRQGHASGSYGEGCQVNRVDANTSLVTMTIGGNDAGFANDLKACYMAERPGGSHEAGCVGQQAAIDARIAAIPRRLIADLRAIRARSPHARIVVLTYPRPFEHDPTKRAGCLKLGWGPASYHLCLAPGDQRFLNDEARRLDDTICGAVAAAGVGAECVDAYDAFDGCELGQPDGCLQSPTAHINGSTVIGINSGAYHPTAKGQRILGELVNRQIAHPTDPPPR
jgi:hypothetical protein